MFIVSAYEETRLQLPCILEFDDIPNNNLEISTPDVAFQHNHMRDIANRIYPIDTWRKILLLIGRDLLQVHHVMEQRIGPDKEPFAQRLPLGWTIIGNTCLSRQHIPKTANVYKTFVTENGRGSILEPCSQYMLVKERFSNSNSVNRLCDSNYDEFFFKRTSSSDDNKI